MNTRPVLMLLRENFSRTYLLWLGTLAGVFATCLGAYIFLSRADRIMPPEIAVAYGITFYGIVFALSAYILAQLVWAVDDRELQLDMPRYLLRLPVKTRTLVACALGWDVVSTALLALASMSIFAAFFDGELERKMPFWGFVMAFPAIMAFLRTIAWAVGSAGPVITTIVMVAVYAIVNQTLSQFGLWPEKPGSLMRNVTLAVIACAFVLSFVFVRWNRKGRLAFLENLGEHLASRSAENKSAVPRFASPDHALRWYENRRQTRIYPGFVFILFAAIWTLGALSDLMGRVQPFDYPVDTILVIIGEIVFVTAYAALAIGTLITGGIFLFQNQRSLLGRGRTFIFIRPASSKTLASARLRAMMRSLAITLVPIIVLSLLVLAVDMRSSEKSVFHGYIRYHGAPDGALIGLGALIGVAAAAWSGLWMANGIAYLAILAIPMSILEYTPFFKHIEPITRGMYALSIAAVLSAIAFVFLFIAAWRKKLIGWRFLVGAAIALPIIAAGFLTCFNLEYFGQGSRMDFGYLWTTIPAFILVPLAPFITVPLATHWARHR